MMGQFCKVPCIDSIDGPFSKQARHVLETIDDTNGWPLLSVMGIIDPPTGSPGRNCGGSAITP